MPFIATATFREFIEYLQKNGELSRVTSRVSPLLEISEITDRICKTPAPHGHTERDQSPAGKLGGKALLFENVEGSNMPVAINTFGSYWRINQALGTENLDALAERVQQLVKPEMPTTLMEKMKKLPDLMKMASYPPKSVLAKRNLSASDLRKETVRRFELCCRSSNAGRWMEISTVDRLSIG